MNPLARLAFWSFCFSLVASYAFWTVFRVRLFRMDLFNIRDLLLIEAERFGSLNDLQYQETRDMINSIIRMAPWLSIGLLVHAILSDQLTISRKRDFPDYLWSSRKKVNSRLVHFLFNETLSGWAILSLIFVYGVKSKAQSRLEMWADRYIDTTVAGEAIACPAYIPPFSSI